MFPDKYFFGLRFTHSNLTFVSKPSSVPTLIPPNENFVFIGTYSADMHIDLPHFRNNFNL